MNLAKTLTFKDQDVLRSIEDDIVNSRGPLVNRFDRLSGSIKHYLLLSSIPFSVGTSVNISSLWPTNCFKCKTVVFRRTMPTGNVKPKYVIIGDAPGVGDGAKDTIDRVLVYGRSSHLLRKALGILGIYWDCWFTNLLKCALENNRPSTKKEVANCFPYLKNEIDTLKPKFIIALGHHVDSMLRQFGYTGIRIYHPSYYVRSNKSYKEYASHIMKQLARYGGL